MEEILGLNNLVKVPKKLNCEIRIYGDNNVIEVDETAEITGKLIVYGNNTTTKIGKNVHGHIFLAMGWNDGRCADFSQFSIDGATNLGDVKFQFMERNSKISVGKGCLFSTGIDVFCSDTHSVIDLEGNLLNYGHFIEIGNHVWIGKDVKIGKNVKIADNSIIGWGSVVTKSFSQSNVIIAGNPAKVVKENINWDGNCPDIYLDKHKNTKSSTTDSENPS